MLVYRVENILGRGPYSTPDKAKKSELTKMLALAHNNSPEHPVSWWDIPQFFEKIDGREYRHGFSSIEQLEVWFKGFEKELKENGFFVSTYEVPSTDVYFGNRQIVFIWENSERIQENMIL